MPDLHTWITKQINHLEALTRAAEQGTWEPWVLRRCTADRKLLEVHKPRGTDWDPYACEGCGYDGSWGAELITKHANDCPVLLAVAEGYGLTKEILAGLDRLQKEPRKPADSSPIGRAASEAWGPALMFSLENTLVLPPNRDETAG
jgi:hypothetical protein